MWRWQREGSRRKQGFLNNKNNTMVGRRKKRKKMHVMLKLLRVQREARLREGNSRRK